MVVAMSPQGPALCLVVSNPSVLRFLFGVACVRVKEVLMLQKAMPISPFTITHILRFPFLFHGHKVMPLSPIVLVGNFW